MPGSTSYYLLRNKYLSRGLLSASNLSTVWPKMVKGQVAASSSAANNTHHTITRAPCDSFTKVRLVVMNADTSSYEFVSGLKVAVTDSDTDPITPSTATWVAVPFSGSTTGITVDAGTAARPTILKSDWVTLSSVAATDSGKPFIMARGYVASSPVQNYTAVNHGQEGASSQSVNKEEYNYMRTFYRAGDHVSTTTGMTNANSGTAYTGNSMIIGWEFQSNEVCATFLNIGDSVASGQGSNLYGLYIYGWFQRVMKWLNKDGVTIQGAKINWINGAWPGQTSANYSVYAQDLIDTFSPAACMYSVYTSNDGTLDATVRGNEETRADTVANYCTSNGVYFIPTISGPSNNWTSAETTQHGTLTTNITAKYPQVIDLSSAITTGGDPEDIIEGRYADAVHPNDRGYYDMAVVAETRLRSIFSLSSTPYYTFPTQFAEYGYDAGITLNGSDVSDWATNPSGEFDFEQVTDAYQPVFSSTQRAAEFNSAAFEHFDMPAGGLDLLRNRDQILCYIVASNDSSGAADWISWASIGTSATNYRYAVRTDFGTVRLYWRRLDGDTGVSIDSTNSFSSGVPFLSETWVNFVDGEQASNVESGYVQALETGSTAHVNTGSTSDTDSDNIEMGSGSNPFDGNALDGLIYTVVFDSDTSATNRKKYRDKLNDEFGLYNKVGT